MSETKEPNSISICQNCIQKAQAAGKPVEMLSGYCIISQCDRCGVRASLAMCSTRNLIEFSMLCWFENMHTAPSIFSLEMKRGRNQTHSYLRYFLIEDGRILEVTRQVAHITGFTLKDCKTYFAIYTHGTNAHDIVERLSEKLYKEGGKIRHERL